MNQMIYNEIAILEFNLDGLEFEFQNGNISEVDFLLKTDTNRKRIEKLNNPL